MVERKDSVRGGTFRAVAREARMAIAERDFFPVHSKGSVLRRVEPLCVMVIGSRQ